MMKQRILITTSTFPRWAGDSTTPFVAQFAEQLSKRGWKVTALAPHAKGAKTHERDHGTEVRRYRYFWPESGETLAYDGGAVNKIRKTPEYALKLLLLLAALFVHTARLSLLGRASVINAHWVIPQGFIAVIVGRLTGKKVVVTVHGSDIFGFNGKLMRQVKAYTLKNADAVVANSSATLRACRNVYDRPDYALIPMGVDMERFKPAGSSKTLKTRYKLERFTVLFVGRLTEQKGAQYLLEALKQLRETGADCKVLIVGEGPQRVYLEQYADVHGLTKDVIFTGWVDASKLQTYYRAADVFVGPSVTVAGSWQEALGLVFVEALACGVPVIATRTGGIADVVEDGVNGILVPERSAEAISWQLRMLYDHPEKLKALAAHARESMRTKFSWESVIKRYEQLLA